MKRISPAVAVASAIGLLLLTLVVAAVGVRPVVAAIGRIGATGFAVFSVYWLVVVAIVGLAWFAVAPGLPASRGADFVWGRLVREAAADLLPFSQLGGLVIGARVVAARGVAESLVFASTIVDITTEMAAQVLYCLVGVGALVLLYASPDAGDALWGALAGLLLLIVAALGFFAAQRRGLAWIGKLARRWAPDAMTRAEAVQLALDEIYSDRARLACAVGLHLLGWVASGVGSWIGLHFMGLGVPLWAVLAVESLMFVVRSAGFMIPAAIGLQEAAYVVIGPLFGLHSDDMLALSLLKRARDVLIGVPTLMIWQALAARRIVPAERVVKTRASSAPGE